MCSPKNVWKRCELTMKWKTSVPLMKFINTLLVVIPFIAVWFIYYEPISVSTHSKQVTALLLSVYTVVFYYFAKRMDGYNVAEERIGGMIFGQIIGLGVANVSAVVMIWMVSIHFPNLWPGILCTVVQIAIIAIVCLCNHAFFFKTHPPKKAIVVYEEREGLEELVHAYGMEKRFQVLHVYHIQEVKTHLIKLAEAETVFMSGVHSKDRNVLLKYCVDNGITALMIPRVGDVLMNGATQKHLFHLPFIQAKRYKPSTIYKIAKRATDLILSGVALVILSPVFLITAIMVKSDGGPAFYKQVRLTKDGKQFKILKFRSMRVDAEKFSGAVLSAGENDPRITKVGHIIRACRLDELPQLINIFKGEMSFVGPRPERPEIAAQYEKVLPEFRLRLQCKAGLTGYAQVYGKYNTEPYDKLLMDLIYIAHPSILEDISIAMATLKILFSKESTEGVGENSTAMKQEENTSSSVSCTQNTERERKL